MAGLVGLVAPARAARSGKLPESLAALRHHPSFETTTLLDEQGLAIGAAYRPGKPPRAHHLPEAGLSVVVYGDPMEKAGMWRVPAVADLAERALHGGARAFLELDGSFVAVLVDRRRGVLEVVNDRMASLPVVHAEAGGAFAFACEAKALFPILELQPRLDLAAAIAFVNCGHPIGHRTQFEGVHLMGPATVLSVELQSARARSEAYWRLRFEPEKGLREAEAAARLQEAMLDSERAAMADAPARVQLLMTGGYDSRAVLGLSARTERLPDEALTWGASDEVPLSDPVIARELARLARVPFRFLRYDADTVPLHAERWCHVSELSSDNGGNFAVSPSFLVDEAGPADVVLIGDQMIGPGGFPLDAADAASSVTKVPRDGLLPAFRRVLSAPGASEAAQGFRGQLADVARAFTSDDAKDVQDSYYFHLYVFRWLLAATYFREPMVTPRRPLLSRAVVDLTATFPQRLRVDKRVLMAALRRRMPELMAIPGASANSLMDTAFASRGVPALREFLREHLAFERVSATPVGPLLDAQAYERFLRDFFAEQPAPSSRSASPLARGMAWRRALSATPALGRLGRRVEPLVKRLLRSRPGSRAQAVVWRLALLSLLQRTVDEGRFRA